MSFSITKLIKWEEIPYPFQRNGNIALGHYDKWIKLPQSYIFLLAHIIS